MQGSCDCWTDHCLIQDESTARSSSQSAQCKETVIVKQLRHSRYETNKQEKGHRIKSDHLAEKNKPEKEHIIKSDRLDLKQTK